jgi:type 1 glutamine amidotransferase
MAIPLIANLVCGSPHRNHDFDFARLQLAQALYDAGGIRTDCYQDYEDTAGILGADLLVSYTSQCSYSPAAVAALRRFLERGGRWFALHASNSVLDNKDMPKLLGTRFITHPRYANFDVEVVRPNDPLMQGIVDFAIQDELYCIEVVTDDVEVLLQTRWGGEALGGMLLPVVDRPLMYRRQVGAGAILYLALGHANRPYDKPFPHMPDQPDLRDPWTHPTFVELVRRGIQWGTKRELG